MELLTSLPADLAVFADPSARGPAPLLRPPDGAGTSSTGATPFELCLALLTAGPPGGEPWPATGKELPALPLDSAAEGDAAQLDAAAQLGFAPAALVDVALQSRLPSGEAPPAALRSNDPVPPPPQAPAELALLPPSGETAVIDAAPQAAQLDSFDPLAALTNADAVPLPLEAGEQTPTTAKTAPQPSWLEAFTNERHLQRPLAPTAAEARAAAAATTAPASLAALQPATATAAVVETTSSAQAGVRRVEMQKVLASAVPTTESTSPPDWLPPATSQSAAHGGTAMAATPAPTAAPQAPLDLRSPGWQEAFASRVQVLVDTKVGEAHIKLNPPELGAVDVKITLVDDKTYVQLTTVTAAARDELAQSLSRLRELFTVSGLELGGASVHYGREGYRGAQGHGSGTDTAGARSSPFGAFAAEGDDGSVLAPRRSLGRIDVFA